MFFPDKWQQPNGKIHKSDLNSANDISDQLNSTTSRADFASDYKLQKAFRKSIK
eukprot:gene11732-12952_t